MFFPMHPGKKKCSLGHLEVNKWHLQKKTHIIIHARKSRMCSLMCYMSSMSEVVQTFSVSVIIFHHALFDHRPMPLFNLIYLILNSEYISSRGSASKKPVCLPGRCFAISSVNSFLKWLHEIMSIPFGIRLQSRFLMLNFVKLVQTLFFVCVQGDVYASCTWVMY